MMRNRVKAGLVAAAMLLAAAAHGKAPDPLFASDTILQMTITAPLGTLARQAADPETSVTGTLSVKGSAPEARAVVLSPRGITRRKREICPFPPIRVEFPEKPPAGSLFQGQKRLKLVTHCRPGAAFQQYVLLEYAAYRMYQVLTPASFRVRLAMIDYVDEKGRPVASRHGFFIESVDDMAQRNDLKELKSDVNLKISQLDPDAAMRFALFQALIGNVDWAMIAGPPGDSCCHNSRPIGVKGATSNLIPVPYDFDFSGMVDAPYAAPPAILHMSNVRQRRFRGFCRHSARVGPALAELTAQRTPMLAVLDAIAPLDERTRGKATAYLDGFFEQGKTQPNFAAELLKTCV